MYELSLLLCVILFRLCGLLQRLWFGSTVMGVAPFNGRGVGLGFGIGCGFGIGWGFGGAPLNILGIGAGGGCGVGLGLGWGFGAAYGTKYLDSKLRFEGIDFDKLKAEHQEQKRIKESSSQQLN